MNKVELKDLIGGALQEKFSKAFEKVIENLQDQNTSFKTKRAITIKLDFLQNEARDDVKVIVNVVEKLAPQGEMQTAFYMGKDLKTGDVFFEEYGKNVKGQLSFNDKMTVDPETGEVLEEKPTEAATSASVVDFRKAIG